jgi:hypothetical protein
MKILFATIRHLTDTKPSSDGHQSLRQSLGAFLVTWCFGGIFLIFIFFKVD